MPDEPFDAATPLGARSVHLRDLAQPFDLGAVVSLVVLVPSPGRVGLLNTSLLAVVAAAVVVFPGVRRSPWPWLGFAAFHAVTYVPQWYLLDNHDALAVYWAAALAIGATSPRRDELLALQARLLLGLTFLLATGWKLLSGQFISGEFFTFALLVDPRFRGVTELLGGVPVEQVHANAMSLSTAANALPAGSVDLVGVDAVSGLVVFLTVVTVLMEAAVAVAMLGPSDPSREPLRSLLLTLFLVGTYLIVPVSRFGILLAAMGTAQAIRRWRVRMGFAVGALVLMMWGSVWSWLVGLA